jgi:hypothetical protein
MKTQQQMFYESANNFARSCELFSDMVKDGLTKSELQRLIAKRPSSWGKFSHWLDILPEEEGIV